MLKLHSKKNIAIDLNYSGTPRISRITTNVDFIRPLRRYETLLVESDIGALPHGFRQIFVKSNVVVEDCTTDSDVIRLDEEMNYLASGDVVRFDPSSLSLTVLYRRAANSNTFLLTERCNSFCLMCSQPPRDIDDSYIVSDVLDAIPLINKEAPEIGLSGGEPTLLGNNLLKIINSMKRHLPDTAIHILSNGRTFADESWARAIANVEHFDLMLGIPIYSDVSTIHDFIVQADGAFDETLKGILNLKKHGVQVEVRVVIHKQNYERLPQLAEFISRNLLFVDHIALMGLEPIGFARANMEELWIDPTNYSTHLMQAVKTFDRSGMNVSIYNHQLCLLPLELWEKSVKSISDWKNEFVSECKECKMLGECGGFFSSVKYKMSENIKAI